MDEKWLHTICNEFAKYGTTLVADAMGKTGVVPGVQAIQGNLRSVAAPVHTATAVRESNWPVHEQLRDTPQGSIVFVDAHDVGDRAILGSLVTSYLWKSCGAEGVVVNGNVRDLEDLLEMEAPVWCKGSNPVGCFNRPVEDLDKALEEHERAQREGPFPDPDGGIVVADPTGVVVVPEHRIEDTYRNLQGVERREEIWFRCLDQGMDTYEIVCLKDYEEEPMES